MDSCRDLRSIWLDGRMDAIISNIGYAAEFISQIRLNSIFENWKPLPGLVGYRHSRPIIVGGLAATGVLIYCGRRWLCAAKQEEEQLLKEQSKLKQANQDLTIMQQDLPIMPQDLPMMPQDIPIMPQDIPIMPQDLPMPQDIPIMPQDIPIMPQDIPIMPQDLPIMQQDIPKMYDDNGNDIFFIDINSIEDKENCYINSQDLLLN